VDSGHPVVGPILRSRGRHPHHPREAFGPRHTTFVWLSVVIFIVSFVAELVLVSSFAASVRDLSGDASGPGTASAAQSAFDGLIQGSLVIVSIISVSFALVLFDLQSRASRLLVVGAVIAQSLVSVCLFVFILNPIIHQAIAQAFASSPMNVEPIEETRQQIGALSGFKLLNAIPAVLFAGGYYLTYDRVARNVIPPPATEGVANPPRGP
jgi:amino acid permease